MTTTYDATLSTPKDVVRFELGDKEAPFRFTDEEIAYQLSVTPNPYLSASELADRVASSYSQKASKTVGPLTIRYNDQASGWAATAARLRRRAARGAKVISTGGAHPRSFAIGMQDNPNTVEGINDDSLTTPIDTGVNTSIGSQS
jgi:hypothetical protein